MRAVYSLLEHDWELYTETVSHIMYGWGEAASRQLGEIYRLCISQETSRAFFKEETKIDVSGLPPQIKAPTLVLHRSQIPFPDLNSVMELAASIPDARLVLQEGTWPPVSEAFEESWSAIVEFVSEGETPKPVPPDLPSGTAVILFAETNRSHSSRRRFR